MLIRVVSGIGWNGGLAHECEVFPAANRVQRSFASLRMTRKRMLPTCGDCVQILISECTEEAVMKVTVGVDPDPLL